MKILFLGTGAADWTAENRNDTGYRRNASALLDDKILIDPGACVPDAIKKYNVDVSAIKYVINTHRHGDHFSQETLDFLVDSGAEFIDLKPDEEIQIENYTITALEANHSIDAVHFLISDGKSRIFYGLDGAWLMYKEIQAIKQNSVDFAVLDATIGYIDGDYRIFEHNNLYMVAEMKKTLEPYIKRFCISHMARTLHTDHDTLAEEMAKIGIEVAYDGMKTEF